MAAAKNQTIARQQDPSAFGGALAPSLDVDAAWVAQAIEARRLAFRLYRSHLAEDGSAVLPADVYCSSSTEDIGRLMADYLAANEKLFELAATLKGRDDLIDPHLPHRPA
jgi:hypothetical protein